MGVRAAKYLPSKFPSSAKAHHKGMRDLHVGIQTPINIIRLATPGQLSTEGNTSSEVRENANENYRGVQNEEEWVRDFGDTIEAHNRQQSPS